MCHSHAVHGLHRRQTSPQLAPSSSSFHLSSQRCVVSCSSRSGTKACLRVNADALGHKHQPTNSSTTTPSLHLLTQSLHSRGPHRLRQKLRETCRHVLIAPLRSCTMNLLSQLLVSAVSRLPPFLSRVILRCLCLSCLRLFLGTFSTRIRRYSAPNGSTAQHHAPQHMSVERMCAVCR